MKTKIPEQLLKELQEIVRLTPILIIGSGHSCGFGFPGMGDLGVYLRNSISSMSLDPEEKAVWDRIKDDIAVDFEASLNRISQADPGVDKLISRVRQLIAELIRKKSNEIEPRIIKELLPPESYALGRLLRRLYEGMPQNASAIDVITTNYDTLIELFCDKEHLPIVTGFEGYRWKFFNSSSLINTVYSRRTVSDRRKLKYQYPPIRFVRLIKPHGSINWSIKDGVPVEYPPAYEFSETAIIVPGPFKYRDATVNSLFDQIRTLGNDRLEHARAIFAIGFGFNDDHLQRVINEKLARGTPLIILSKGWTDSIRKILDKHSHVIAFCEAGGEATRYHCDGKEGETEGSLWQLDCFMRSVLE